MEWMNDFLKPEVIWALVGLALLLLEFAVPGLIIFFFGIGAWIVAGLCLCADIGIHLQIIIFLVTSILLLAVLRQWLRGVFVGHTYGKQDAMKDLSDYLGQKVTVQDKIVPPAAGTVELHGVAWKAQSSSVIESGQIVEVVGQESLTLIVKPLTS